MRVHPGFVFILAKYSLTGVAGVVATAAVTVLADGAAVDWNTVRLVGKEDSVVRAVGRVVAVVAILVILAITGVTAAVFALALAAVVTAVVTVVVVIGTMLVFAISNVVAVVADVRANVTAGVAGTRVVVNLNMSPLGTIVPTILY